MRLRSRDHYFRRIFVGVALAAVLAPAAQAEPRFGDRPAPTVALISENGAGQTSEQATSAALISENGAGQTPSSTSNSNLLISENGLGQQPLKAAEATALSSDGFDWTYVGIGGAAAFGLALMAMTMMAATRRRGAPAH
jgi:hypothetical protein